MKVFSIVIAVVICFLASGTSVSAKTLRDHHKPVVRQEATSEGAGYEGLDPVLGRNIGSVFITDIINVFVKPGSTSFIALFLDLISFILMPIIGGISMASTTYNYALDAITYENA